LASGTEAAGETTLASVASMTKEAGRTFQIHVNEHVVGVERSLIERGSRQLEYLHSVGALNSSTLLAHATLMTPYEVNLLRETNASVAYNPVASQWKGNAVLNAQQLDALGVRFGLGTDGTRGDAFRLMDAAEACQRLAYGISSADFSCGGGWMWLHHASHLGVQAVGLDGVTGEIRSGLAADFLLVDLNVPEMTPSWDLTWEMVRLANRDQIEAVYVNGTLRLWRGWPVDWDAGALMAEAARMADAAVAQAPIQRVHPHSSEHRMKWEQGRRP
jgi:cytosine/adenosine deaminase-related metal-dependent hydrolase